VHSALTHLCRFLVRFFDLSIFTSDSFRGQGASPQSILSWLVVCLSSPRSLSSSKFPSLSRRLLSDLNRNPPFFPSGIAFQLSIRVRSHPTRNTLHVGTFGLSAESFLTILFVTHVNIITSDRSSVGFSPFHSEILPTSSSSLYRTFYYLIFYVPIQDNHRFGSILQSRVSLAQVSSSCTLLHVFERMAASKPTAKLSLETHFLSHLVWNWRPYRLIWAVSLLTYSTYLLPLDSVRFFQVNSQFTPDRYTLTCPHWYRALPSRHIKRALLKQLS
jgi:hypothetical protein